MTDRELLEAAAKAYWGDEIEDVCSVRWLEDDQAIGYTHGDNQDHNGQDSERVWNPLDDDGDALRLAVKLKLTIQRPWHDDERTEVREVRVWSSLPEYVHEELAGADECAATRRAIVRAAAAMAHAADAQGDVG